MTRQPRRTCTPRPSFVTLTVLWVIVMASAVIAIVQAASFGQASAGREALARARAYWAARAGVEFQLAAVEAGTQNPDPDDAFTLIEDMDAVSDGTVAGASFRVFHSTVGGEVPGPIDAASKININKMTAEDLMALPFMTEDVAQSILDWIDPDEDPNPLGAEAAYYQGLPFPYEPRNGPMRSLFELELVAGVEPWYVRGEDWNLNGILDPNENDGNASDPPDNADGILDAGWSAIITAESLDGGWSASGQARLNLTEASESDLVARTQMTSDQAKIVIDYVNLQTSATMGDFLRRTLQQLSAQLGTGQGQQQTPVQPLSDEQLTALLAECEINRDTSLPPQPGKLNINTCDSRIFEYLPSVDSTLADNIMAERDARRQGFLSLVELKAVPGMTNQALAALYDVVDVRTNVFLVTSRGRDDATGIEVEITAAIDRSSLPARLISVTIK